MSEYELGGLYALVLAVGVSLLLAIGCQAYSDSHRPHVASSYALHVAALPLCDVAAFDITKECRFH